MAEERQVFAALANSQVRELYARVILGEAFPEPNAKEKRGLAQLERAGLITLPEAGSAPRVTDVFAELLASGKTAQPTGYERFLENGRVARWPSKARDKRGFIVWIMEQCLAPGESVGERELNERIKRMSDDPALIRRYCVDLGSVERSPDGATYRRVS